MKSTDMFPSKYLKAEDFDGDAVVVIEKVVKEKFTDPQTKQDSEKAVAYFKDVDKGLILNKTNWNLIAKQHGDESDEWIGKEIWLTVLDVEAFGDVVQAIRVKQKSKPKTGTGIGKKAPISEAEAAEASADEEAGAERKAKGKF